MAKVVVTSLKDKRSAKKAASSIVEKRVVGADGRSTTMRTLDAGSRTFGDDLQRVFQKNVSRARRDNKRLLGSADVVPRKN